MAARKQNSQDIYLKLLDEIKSNSLNPMYYLYGDEEFYLDLLQDAFTKLIPEHERDFNYDLLYGQDLSLGRLLAMARSFPMMAERRMIIVRNFQQIEKAANDVDSFIHYVENPNPTCVLILIDSSKPAGNTRFGKAILKSKTTSVSEFNKLPDYLIPNWIQSWVQSTASKNIEPQAAQMLSQYVGNSLQLIKIEIDKLITYSDKSDTITVDAVKKVIGMYREYSVFDLKDAVMARDLNKSLYIAEKILQHSKSEAGDIISIVAFLNSTFVTIWQILRLVEKGMNKNQIQTELEIRSAWFFDKSWNEAARYRYAEMPVIFEALLDADRAIKGFSTLDNASIMFFLIKRII